jgi:hypothetical protein
MPGLRLLGSIDPDREQLVLDRLAADYWRALYLGTLILVAFRFLGPAVNALRHACGRGSHRGRAGIISLRITGRRLDRLDAVQVSSPLALPRPETLVGITPSRCRLRLTGVRSGSR